MCSFPHLQQTVNICRSEEAARANEKILSGQSGVSAVKSSYKQSDKSAECKKCGRASHLGGVVCPATGKTCHICGKPDHFSPKCPNRDKGKSSTNGGVGGGSKTKMAHITISNVQPSHRRRGSPTISLTVSCVKNADRVTTIQATPDPGAEVTVGGCDVMEAIGVSEEDLATSSFDLVMADRSTPLLSIGQRDIRVRYGDQDARITVVFCPEIHGMLVCRGIVSAWIFYIKNIRSLC